MEEDGERAKGKKYLNYEEYKKIAFMLISHIHQKEEMSEAGAESKGEFQSDRMIPYIVLEVWNLGILYSSEVRNVWGWM